MMPTLVDAKSQSTCRSCGQLLSLNATFCTACGAVVSSGALAARPRCGSANPVSSRFCAQCGASMGAPWGGGWAAPNRPMRGLLGSAGKGSWGKLALGGLGGMLLGSLLGGGRGLFGGFGDRDGDDGFGDGDSGDRGE